MDRRRFLKFLSGACAAAVVAASVPIGCLIGEAPESLQETIGEWGDYTNFSSFAISSSIDESVAKAAEELSYAYGQKIEQLWRHL